MRDRILAWAEPIFGELLAQLVAADQPVLSSIGGVLAVLIAMLWGRREELVWWKTMLVGGSAALMGLLMARVFWAMIYYEHFMEDPMQFFDPYRGGAVSFGALFGATVGGALGAKIFKAPMWNLADVMFPAGLVGIAFARVGCLMRSCDYGIPSSLPWAIRYPRTSPVFRRHVHEGWVPFTGDLSDPVHPFPLYLSLWAVIVFLVAFLKPTLFGTHPGQRAIGAGMLWLTGRFIIEFLRHPGNAPMVAGPINMGQALAVAGIVVFGGIYWWLGREGRGGVAAG